MKNPLKKKSWTVYILRNEKKALYTGITTDLERRVDEHRNQPLKGAKFARFCKILNLVYSCDIGEHGLALRVESKIKQLKKEQKEIIVKKGFKQKELYDFLSLGSTGL